MKKKQGLTPLERRFLSFPAIEIDDLKAKIINDCKISKPTFYRWLRQPEDVPPIARRILAILLQCHEKEIFNN